MDGQTSEEICKELNMPASNLWVLLYRARLRFGQMYESSLAKQGGHEP